MLKRVKNFKALAAIALLVSSNATFAAEASRNDFEGDWVTSSKKLIKIVQYGENGALVSDTVRDQFYGLEFNTTANIPSNFVTMTQNREVRAVKLDFLQGGSYTIKLTTTKDSSTASGTFEADIAVPSSDG